MKPYLISLEAACVSLGQRQTSNKRQFAHFDTVLNLEQNKYFSEFSSFACKFFDLKREEESDKHQFVHFIDRDLALNSNPKNIRSTEIHK